MARFQGIQDKTEWDLGVRGFWLMAPWVNKAASQVPVLQAWMKAARLMVTLFPLGLMVKATFRRLR